MQRLFTLVSPGAGRSGDVDGGRVPREKRRVPAYPERHPVPRQVQQRRVSAFPLGTLRRKCTVFSCGLLCGH